jgi:hypothetical protein
VNHSHQPFNNTLTQGKLKVNSIELERTPGMAAVSQFEQEAGTLFPAPLFLQDTCSTDTTNSGYIGQRPIPSPPYLDQYANVVHEAKKACPGYFVVGTCDNGHVLAKELLCGKEWCPTCGQDGSKIHLRRFARWLPKLYQCSSIGYFVFTIPEGIREQYKTKEALSLLAKKLVGDKSRHIPGILKDLGFKRGLIRWHFFGDKSTKYNPHLNVIVEAGRISPETLDKVKLAWAGVLGVDIVVVQYSFTRKQAKMVHILKYVTRSTFHEVSWDEKLSYELYNFRNMRSFGHWDDPSVWQLKGKPKYEHIELLSKGLCPVCRHKLTWGKAIPIAWLKYENVKDLSAGYYQLNTS